MMPKIDFQNAIQKLDDMISKRFDARVQFVSAQSLQPSQVLFYETVRRNAGAPLIVTHNNMLLPVRVEGSLVGAIRVFDITHLSGLELSRVKETIDLVMEENFIAQSLDVSDELQDLESKVIPFKKASNSYAEAN
jgi:hypothetical protein